MATTQPTSLATICRDVATEFKLDEGEVLKVAARNVGVGGPLTVSPLAHGGSANSLGVTPTKSQMQGSNSFVSLTEVVDLPKGKTLNDMNVMELKQLIEKETGSKTSGGEEELEGAVPFLLRYVLGEFHYGQRATRPLPGQKKAGSGENKNDAGSDLVKQTSAGIDSDATAKSSGGSGEAGSGEPTNHEQVVAKAFDVLANESKFRHLHQVAGWVDLDDKSVWDSYVADVVDGKISEYDSVFEAGCGVLAFLTACYQMSNNTIKLGGVDGARKTVELVKSDLLSNILNDAKIVEEARNNFFVGMLPDCLEKIPDNSWDVVVCNSVFQYLASHDQAKAAVKEMIRIAKKWVIIADICDAKYDKMTQYRKSTLGWTDELPDYRTYEKRWWEDNFDRGEHLVSIKHVGTKTYARRTERYVVYIEKNACPPLDHSRFQPSDRTNPLPGMTAPNPNC